MDSFINQAYAYTEAEAFFNNLTELDLLKLSKELDCVYDLLESLGIVSRYNTDRHGVLKDFRIIEAMGGVKQIVALNTDTEVAEEFKCDKTLPPKDIPTTAIINELVKMFEKR
jgi:N-acetylglutamate synthase-like GNAT family acetyltransferase